MRTVLPFSDVIRDSAVQLVLTHQRARTSGTSDELTVLYSNGLDDKSVTLATWTNPSRWLRDNCHERLLALTPGGEGPALERQKKALLVQGKRNLQCHLQILALQSGSCQQAPGSGLHCLRLDNSTGESNSTGPRDLGNSRTGEAVNTSR